MSSVEQITDDDTVTCADETCDTGGRALVWMLDLDADDRPYEAHQVVSQTETAAVTACGQTVTPASHPRGWWQTHPGELPLAAHAVHCRRR